MSVGSGGVACITREEIIRRVNLSNRRTLYDDFNRYVPLNAGNHSINELLENGPDNLKFEIFSLSKEAVRELARAQINSSYMS